MPGGRFAPVHLVLGSDRVDLAGRVLVIARTGSPDGEAPGADLRWIQGAAWSPGAGPAPALTGRAGAEPSGPAPASIGGPPPWGADAGGVDDVHRLADAGAVVLGLADPDPGSCAAAVERGLAVVVPAAQAERAAALVAADRLLVLVDGPSVDGLPAIACLDLADEGPAAWGRATVALAVGVRAVRTPEPRSLRRVAAVVDRIRAAHQTAGVTS